MVKDCQTCGEKGITKALIYCTNCWDTVEHIYCLGLSPGDIDGGFSWTCDSCAKKDKQRVGIVEYGDQLDKMAKCSHLLPVSEKLVTGVPVVGPIWSGGIKVDSGGIKVGGSFSGKLEEMEVFMPKTSYLKVVKVKQSLQLSLCFSMKNRHAVWPAHFDELGAAHHDIEFFMFPEISRSETDYDELVEYMISNDLAMTSHMGNLQLIIFTSLEQQENQQQIQGKYYLWGMFKWKDLRNYKSPRGKKTSAEKRRISKCVRIECELIPLLSPGCKRARSKRRRISTTLNKEAEKVQAGKVCDITIGETKPVTVTDDDDNLYKEGEFTSFIRGGVMTDGLPNNEQSACGVDDRFTSRDSAEMVIINYETKAADRQSWDSNMEIDEPSDSYMKIDGPSDEAVKDCLDLQPQNSVSLETDPEIETRLAPYLNSETLSVSEVPNPAIIVERDSCSDENPDKRSNVEDMMPRLNECSMANDCVELQPLSNVSQESDLGNKTCLTPFLNSKELPVSEVPTLITNVERDLCSDENPGSIICDTVTVSNQNNVENMILMLNEGSTGNGLTVETPMVLTDPKNCSCLISLLDYKEESDIKEANLGVHGKGDSCMDEKSLGTYSNSVADDHQKIVEDSIPRISEITAGITVASPTVTTDPENFSCSVLIHYEEESELKKAYPLVHEEINLFLDEKSGDHSNSVADDHPKIILNTVPGVDLLAVKVDQPECRVSDLLPELDSCTTPLVNYEEQSRPSSPSSATMGLEADDDEELEEGEIPTKAPKIFNEESEMITTSSMLEIVDDFHETTSDIVRVQVGQYMIKSDLASILKKILNKYGDIALGCSIMPEVLLEEICKTFQDLESVPFSGLRCHHLDRLKSLCQLGEALETDMKWLSKRCEELEKTALQLSQYPSIKKERDHCNKAIRSLEEKVNVDRACMAKFLEDKQSIEEEFETLKQCQKKLHYKAECVKSETSRFLGKSLMDGLI